MSFIGGLFPTALCGSDRIVDGVDGSRSDRVHGVCEDGTILFNRSLRRAQLLQFFELQPACLVGMEGCATGHYWAHELTALGQEVRLMPPNYVKPYVKRGKSDAADAEAICEAVTRPTIRTVPIKSANQKALLCQRRTREFLVGQRTKLSNAIRGLLGAFGKTIRLGPTCVREFAESVCGGMRRSCPWAWCSWLALRASSAPFHMAL